MRRWLLIGALLVGGCAKSEQTKAAPANAIDAKAKVDADPAPVTDGDVTEATVHGLKILIKRVPNAEFVAGRLLIRGGVRNWSKDDAGIEQLALAVATRGGTESLDKDAFSRKMAALGATIGGGAEEDFSTLTAKSPKEAWAETFGLMVDAFLRPALPPSEIEVQRQGQLVRLKREQEMPDSRLRFMGNTALFTGHPYENRAIGTIENVTRFDRAALAAHLAKLRQASRLLLVIVGDVDPHKVIEAATRSFAGLPMGNYQNVPLPHVRFELSKLTAESRPLPTNYIQAMFPGPARRDPDFVPGLVAMSVLSEREWDEVRSKRNLSYAPNAGLRYQSALPIGYLYVTAVDPQATMKVMLGEVKRLREQPVPQKELAGDESVYVTNLLQASESTDGQADLLGRMELQSGDWRRVRTLPKEIAAVTPDDVQRFAKKWMGHFQAVLLGDPAKLDPGLFNEF